MKFEDSLIMELSYMLISSFLIRMPDKFKIRRISKSGILTTTSSKQLQQFSLNECLNFEENQEIISEFIKILESSFSNCDLSSFYTNIENLKIDLKKENFFISLLNFIYGSKTGSFYLASKNKIYTGNEFEHSQYKRAILFHELLHMASTRKINKSYFSGFHLSNKDISIGEGLNEGYTELLNCRYFDKNSHGNSYYDLQMIAHGVESIYGKSKMEEAYFSNNLKGLIEELEKYVTYDEAIRLLINSDNLLKRNIRNDYGKCISLAKEIRVDIANIRLKQLKEKKENGEISKQKYISCIYEQELYINGYILSKKSDNKYVIMSGPSREYGFVEISDNDFDYYANRYFESHRDISFQANYVWKNKQGVSTCQTIETLLRSKKKSNIKSSNIELEEMFDSKEFGSNFTSDGTKKI